MSTVSNDILVQSIVNSSIYSYYDTSITNKGRKYLYTIYNCVNGVYSNPLYGAIYAPYRNISQVTPVYIKTFSYDPAYLSVIETWATGAPEFRIVCNVVRGDSGSVQQGGNRIIAFPNTNVGSCSYSMNNIILNWLPATAYDNMILSIYEADNGDEDVSRTITASYGLTVHSPGAGIVDVTLNDQRTVTTTYKAGDYYLGDVSQFYFENPQQTLTILNDFGIEITISDTNN